jgi:hypothetical protein
MALVVQDLDGMGLFLSGRAGSASGQKITIIPNEHGRVSRLLLRLSRWQADAVKTTGAAELYRLGSVTCERRPYQLTQGARHPRLGAPASPICVSLYGHFL